MTKGAANMTNTERAAREWLARYGTLRAAGATFPRHAVHGAAAADVLAYVDAHYYGGIAAFVRDRVA